jgi:hypothetical protein
MTTRNENDPANKAPPGIQGRIFMFQILLLALISVLMTTAELGRWRRLSETHINTKGLTLVRTIEQHAVRLIGLNDNDGLKEMASALTSPEIPDNDVISVQILDSKMNKLAESSPELGVFRSVLTHLPATVVVAHPLIETTTGQNLGVLRMVFSNRYFEQKSQAVIYSAVGFLLLGLFLAAFSTWFIGRMVQTPVGLLAEAAIKLSEGETDSPTRTLF